MLLPERIRCRLQISRGRRDSDGGVGQGIEVRFGKNHKLVLWREGLEDFSAAETGRAADIMRERLNVLLQNNGPSSEN